MIKLTGDSSLDLTPELRKELRIDTLAPLHIHMPNGRVYDDVENFDSEALLLDMKAQNGAPTSSCPSPQTYGELIGDSDEAFIVTLSSQLSGSYNSAMLAAEHSLETAPKRLVHVFDSKSASAGETLVAMKIRALEAIGKTFSEIVSEVEHFISNMRTFFVLEDLSVFIKNGRIKKIAGLVSSVLSIVPVLCDDGNGTITMSAKARGHSMALRKLVDAVSEEISSHGKSNVKAVIGHCKCLERAQALREALMERISALSEVVIVPTGGLSSMYANRGGVIVAFG